MRKVSMVLAAIGVAIVLGLGARAQRQATNPRVDAVRALDDSSAQLAQLVKIHADTVQIAEKISTMYSALNKKATEVDGIASRAGAGSSQQLLQATKQMQEMQMSFNLQYVQLQNQMQNENREFTAVSNIMKTKHDTLKNAISNIR
jgi:hypothetical protein